MKLEQSMHFAIEKFIANEKEYNYVQSIQEDDKYIRIEYAFDEYFKKHKAYNISYITKSKKYENTSWRDLEVINHKINVGKCMYYCTERRISDRESPTNIFVFKKIKRR